MTYKQVMQWGKKHRKGTNQPIIMSTSSGFWPSYGFLKEFWEYREECKEQGIEAMDCEAYYRATLRR